MRHALVILLLAASAAASAADPGDIVAITASVTSERFPDSKIPGPPFEPGARVQLIAVDGGRARVMMRGRFGWVPLEVVDMDPPEVTSSAQQAASASN